MANTTVFDYQQFCSLEADGLVKFMEPILANGNTDVSDLDIERLMSQLPQFDEYHTVYAIEMGMLFAPQRFANAIVPYLSDHRQSVRLAVHRRLLSLPKSMISESLLQACQARLNRDDCPDDVGDIIDRLRELKNTK